MSNDLFLSEGLRFEALYKNVSEHLRRAKHNVVRIIDTEMVKAYWLIGRDIVEEEQYGSKRAGYGGAILRNLSIRLKKEFGRGIGENSLAQMRKFYVEYQLVEEFPILDALRPKLSMPDFQPNIGWTHYRILMRIKNQKARKFYEIEANQSQWTSRTLKRQVDSLLYERLAMSQDKVKILALSQEGQDVRKPSDIIKDPMVLEFLGLPPHYAISESQLESALINHMQDFLLELGKGFAFVSRQKPIVVDGRYYYPDLVFYHTILKCYAIIDIKVDQLSHGDLGQMQFYVNYYDQERRTTGDNPTIGIILCTDKSDAVVKYTLGEKAKQIFASQYQFHLPTEKELAEELKKEIQEIEHQKNTEILI